MPNVLILQKDRAEIVSKVVAFSDKIEKRTEKKLSDDERTEWAGYKTQIADIDAEIERTEFVNGVRMAKAELKTETVNKNENRTWGCTGEYLLALRTASSSGRVDPRLVGDEQRATGGSIGVPSDGGFLADTDTVAEIFKKVNESSVVASKCKHITVGPTANGVKMNYIDESSRVNGSRWGGVLGYWKVEANALTTSKIKFGQWKCDLETLGTMLYATEEMLQDAQQLGSIYTQSTSEEIAYLIDDAVIRGDGAGKPLGILSSPALVTVAKESGQAADTVKYANIVNMYSRMIAPSRANGIWLINQDVEPQLFSMTMTDSTGIPAYLPANGLSGQPYATLMGRPVIAVEQCSTIGDVGDILFVDLSQYCIIEKGGINSAESIHVKFAEAETAYRTLTRLNGQSLWHAALTPAHGTKTLSPFIALAAR